MKGRHRIADAALIFLLEKLRDSEYELGNMKIELERLLILERNRHRRQKVKKP